MVFIRSGPPTYIFSKMRKARYPYCQKAYNPPSLRTQKRLWIDRADHGETQMGRSLFRVTCHLTGGPKSDMWVTEQSFPEFTQTTVNVIIYENTTLCFLKMRRNRIQHIQHAGGSQHIRVIHHSHFSVPWITCRFGIQSIDWRLAQEWPTHLSLPMMG